MFRISVTEGTRLGAMYGLSMLVISRRSRWFGAALPAEARYDTSLREFTLPYDAVRRAADPDEALLAFCQSTYDAAADRGGWDRAGLDRHREAWP